MMFSTFLCIAAAEKDQSINLEENKILSKKFEEITR